MILNVEDVYEKQRVRKDMGDIDALANSIREFGLIQPITLYRGEPGDDRVELCAGGRRLAAMKRVGIKELHHGVHYIWRDEEDEYRKKATELEENLRRQNLTWQEEIDAKAKLLELMETIHGTTGAGGLTRAERQAGDSTGFGVRKLASMLGESVGKTSKDLQIARAVAALPQLRAADTKEGAFRQLSILGAVATMAKAAMDHKVNNPATTQLWTLHEGDFKHEAGKVDDESVDLVYTDLPFGVSLSSMSKHHGSVVLSYEDSRDAVVGDLSALARESFRVLRADRYAVFFFGFNYYGQLVAELERAGFKVNYVPVIWFKHTRSTENPNTRYANAYDPALVAMKGSPVFIRPGQTNLIDTPSIPNTDRLQIAQQPTDLVKRFIWDMTGPGAHILDWCAGSGTTGAAAVELKRRVTLFEREPSAAMLIRARLGAMK